MTEKEFVNSINDMKVVLSIEQYDYLVQCKSKYLAIEQLTKSGRLTTETAMAVIEDVKQEVTA